MTHMININYNKYYSYVSKRGFEHFLLKESKNKRKYRLDCSPDYRLLTRL